MKMKNVIFHSIIYAVIDCNCDYLVVLIPNFKEKFVMGNLLDFFGENRQVVNKSDLKL